MLREFPLEIQEYFRKLDQKCQKRLITLKLTSGRNINSNGRCSGQYDSFHKELVVALGKGWEHSFLTALHEWSHCDQHFDYKSIWHTKISDNHTKFFLWLKGENFEEPRILAQSALAIESDCERRTVLEIRKKYSHIIDPSRYIVRSNCYLAAHLLMMNRRSWLKKSPYDYKIMAHCPPKLIKSFADIPKNLELAMERFL